MWEYGLSSPRRLSWRGLEERNTHFHFVGRQVPLGRCIISLLLFYSLCGTGPALGNHSTCPPATTISSGSGHHSYQTNDHLLWEFSWENSSLFLEGDDWKESHESGDKEGSILLLHGEGLPENETQTGRLRREGGEREREMIPVEHLDADLSDSRNTWTALDSPVTETNNTFLFFFFFLSLFELCFSLITEWVLWIPLM